MVNTKRYSRFNCCSAVALIIALLWLTVSAPFVFSIQQEIAKQQTSGSPTSGCEEESGNPLGGSEEKSSVSSSFSEEFLHHQERLGIFMTDLFNYHPPADDGTYIAYHGELLVPPPNVA
jgi:hypothetical protein